MKKSKIGETASSFQIKFDTTILMKKIPKNNGTLKKSADELLFLKMTHIELGSNR